MTDPSPVLVRPFPEKMTSGQAHAFLRQVQESFSTSQPHLVIDFAEVSELGAVGVQVLLRCLEDAMKRNGDVKLAAVSSGPALVLETMSVNHLFEIFDSPEDAVQSFHYIADYQPEPVEAPLYASPLPVAGEVAGFAAD